MTLVAYIRPISGIMPRSQPGAETPRFRAFLLRFPSPPFGQRELEPDGTHYVQTVSPRGEAARVSSAPDPASRRRQLAPTVLRTAIGQPELLSRKKRMPAGSLAADTAHVRLPQANAREHGKRDENRDRNRDSLLARTLFGAEADRHDSMVATTPSESTEKFAR